MHQFGSFTKAFDQKGLWSQKKTLQGWTEVGTAFHVCGEKPHAFLPRRQRKREVVEQRKARKWWSLLLTWWMWPGEMITICMWLARLWLSGYRSGMLWYVACHEIVVLCVCVYVYCMCANVCVFECKTSSVAAGVKVAQAVNSTHSLILSPFRSHSFLFLFPWFGFTLLCSAHLLQTPLYQPQAAPLIHMHTHACTNTF